MISYYSMSTDLPVTVIATQPAVALEVQFKHYLLSYEYYFTCNCNSNTASSHFTYTV